MGMYTEFYFRANIKGGAAAAWLDSQINGNHAWFDTPFDDHDFFKSARWVSVFIGGGSVSQESRKPVFRRKAECGEPYHHQLVIASSLKNYGDEISLFIDWITPHLDMHVGDFLGYSLYEDSTDDTNEYREHPTLYFYGREAVWKDSRGGPVSTPVEQATVERVAEAVWRADGMPGMSWDASVIPGLHARYTALAVAAIEALQLTEERTVHYPRSPIESDAEYVRLVGPWRTA